MTTFATSPLQHLLFRSFALAVRPGSGGQATARVLPAQDFSETCPMLYRSEAFAEDLWESHPLDGTVLSQRQAA